MPVPQRLNFIVEKLLPTVLIWGFTREDLLRAIELAHLPKSFTIYSPRRAQIVPDVRHWERMRDRGQTLDHAAVIETKTSPTGGILPKSSRLYIFVMKVDGAPVLRADWQMLPEAERTFLRRYEPKMPNLPTVDPGDQGHTADVGANRLQRLLNRR